MLNYQVQKSHNISGIDYYNVFAIVKNTPIETWKVVFQGTLPECEAWINLKEKGYL